MSEFPKEIKGKRIELKTVEPTFANALMIFEIVKNSRDHLLPWLDWAASDKVEDTFAFLQTIKESREKKMKYDFGIFKDGKYIGNAGIFNISEKTRSAEIGYWLDKAYAGQGYVSEALKLLEKEAFGNYGINRIVIKCDTRNTPSANVARRNGYTLEGTLREDRYSGFEQKLVNGFLFAKLKAEA